MLRVLFILLFFPIVVLVQAYMWSYVILNLGALIVGHAVVFAFWKCIVLAFIPGIGQLCLPLFLIALLFA